MFCQTVRGSLAHCSLLYTNGAAWTYTRDIAIFGLDEREHLFRAWCYTFNALCTYAFGKVVCREQIATGQRVSGEEVCLRTGGALHPREDG